MKSSKPPVVTAYGMNSSRPQRMYIIAQAPTTTIVTSMIKTIYKRTKPPPPRALSNYRTLGLRHRCSHATHLAAHRSDPAAASSRTSPKYPKRLAVWPVNNFQELFATPETTRRCNSRRHQLRHQLRLQSTTPTTMALSSTTRTRHQYYEVSCSTSASISSTLSFARATFSVSATAC